MFAKSLISILLMIFIFLSGKTQQPYNFDFEEINRPEGLPTGLHFDSNPKKAYQLSIDSADRQHGKYAMALSQHDSTGAFGAFSFSIKPNFEAKKISLTGFIKTENVKDGFAGLWMRIDGDEGVLAFDNMAARGIKGTSGWTEYRIDLDFDEQEARSVSVGGLLAGKGKIWVDNLSVLVDNKDISQASPRKKPLPGAVLDTAFQENSGIQSVSLTKENISNLTNLGMIWGFLKYYHPAVAVGNYNWDAALFRILPRVLQVSTKDEFNSIIEKWVDELGKPAPCSNCQTTKKDSDTKLLPDYGWIFQKNNLSESLQSKLEYIRNNRHLGKSYYIDAVQHVGNPVFKHEHAYPRMLNPDAGYRLLALYRYWNIIQYFFPYKHLIGEDWNNLLPEFIPKFIDTKDSLQYDFACLELIARIHDTHGVLYRGNTLQDEMRGKYRAPIQTKFIEGELVVTGYYQDAPELREKIRIGDIISKIDGQSVKELLSKNLYLTAASNYETQLRDLPRYSLMRSRHDVVELEILHDGKPSTITINNVLASKMNMSLDFDPNPLDSSYKIIHGNIGYIFPGKFNNNQLDAIEKTFAGTRGMIIDMRTYPSDFMPFSFGAYIKPKASPFVKFTVGDLDEPGVFRFGRLLSNGEKNSNYYKEPIVILVNSISQSQAEYTVMAFQSADQVTVIGSQTAGADGNVSLFSLPGGLSTMISGIGVYYPDGTETQRKGVKIDRIIHPTIQGIKEGKDELLDQAIDLILSKNK